MAGKAWQITKIVFSTLVAVMLIAVMFRYSPEDGSQGIGSALGYFGFLGVLLLCCVALGWDAVKKLRVSA
tara:strand:+ start:1278 stop:1487 length:210 start_codon:yes stop_codon:yes gene_type:complete